tara:strand:- start:847 stop:1035 length:189 start_codon:yes stop_codon:yes gene_type:complete
MHCTYQCKACDAEIECEVHINEECDLPETCPECNAVIPEAAYDEMQEQAMDIARDMSDRFDD